MTVTIDRGHEIPPYSPVCAFCRHLSAHGEGRSCRAFDSIPLEIWEGRNDHRAPYRGDGGIRFEPRRDAAVSNPCR